MATTSSRMWKYSDYHHRHCVMFWPLNVREQWGILTNRIIDARPNIHPIDAECEAFEIIRAKIVKSKQDNPSLDLKVLGFGDPDLVESPDPYLPDPDRFPMDSNGYTQSWWDDDGLVGYYIYPDRPAYKQALADEVERFAKATTGERKIKPPRPVEGPSLALSPDMESRLIRTEESQDVGSDTHPLDVDISNESVPVVDQKTEPAPTNVIRIDPAACKQSKIPSPVKKPPRRGKGKHDKAVGTFDFGE